MVLNSITFLCYQIFLRGGGGGRGGGTVKLYKVGMGVQEGEVFNAYVALRLHDKKLYAPCG